MNFTKGRIKIALQQDQLLTKEGAMKIAVMPHEQAIAAYFAENNPFNLRIFEKNDSMLKGTPFSFTMENHSKVYFKSLKCNTKLHIRSATFKINFLSKTLVALPNCTADLKRDMVKEMTGFV